MEAGLPLHGRVDFLDLLHGDLAEGMQGGDVAETVVVGLEAVVVDALLIPRHPLGLGVSAPGNQTLYFPARLGGADLALGKQCRNALYGFLGHFTSPLPYLRCLLFAWDLSHAD